MLSATKLLGPATIFGALACGRDAVAPASQAVALHVRAAGTETGFAINVGTEVTLEAIPISADSSLLGAPTSAHWVSSDTIIATMTDRGVIHTYCAGQVLVTASAVLAGRSLSGTRPILVATTGPTCVGR